MPTHRTGVSFKDGLTMMAAKAVGVDPELAAAAGDQARTVINLVRHAARARSATDKARLIREAQEELRRIDPARHGKLVSALQARVLAAQGRGGDTEVAHLSPGEVVLPRSLQTPELMHAIAALAHDRGIDPDRLVVSGRSSVNPHTEAEEFGMFDRFKHWLVEGPQPEGPGMDAMERSSDISQALAEGPGLSNKLDIEEIPIQIAHKSKYGLPYILNPSGGQERNDAAGHGWYNAPRGERKHKGLDITVGHDGQEIRSPIEGVIVSRRSAYGPMTTTTRPEYKQYRAVEIKGTGPYEGLSTILRYVDDTGPAPDSHVAAGAVIGRAQNRHKSDLSGRMLPHVHLETILRGENVDPADFLRHWSSQRPGGRTSR